MFADIFAAGQRPRPRMAGTAEAVGDVLAAANLFDAAFDPQFRHRRTAANIGAL